MDRRKHDFERGRKERHGEAFDAGLIREIVRLTLERATHSSFMNRRCNNCGNLVAEGSVAGGFEVCDGALASGGLDVTPRNRACRSRNVDQMEDGMITYFLQAADAAVGMILAEGDMVGREGWSVRVEGPAGFIGDVRNCREDDLKTDARRIAG